MATTDTSVQQLIINKLTKAQYDAITPSETELYFVTDDAGISLADVIAALGYTPYNSNNPAGYITASALSDYEQTTNKVTSITSSSTDTQYPSAKCIYDNLVAKVEAGTAANIINVTKAGTVNPITINNVANATSANSIITKDGTTAYQWIGTTAQYNTALNNGTITNTTLCIITDD